MPFYYCPSKDQNWHILPYPLVPFLHLDVVRKVRVDQKYLHPPGIEPQTIWFTGAIERD